ncbi:hypothetical protein Chor_005186 [Crotalus horridus]
MQANLGAVLFTLALWAICSPVLSTEGKRKLQIGVKKRVDNCPIKMCEGEKRKLVIPSELGGATLIFEVELLKIERRQEL